ncbi:MAG: hypothetical protein A2Z34_07080 [Planctomycetes bacterium RBG_16_59_8]|nr:MAG: hypothetical protein A2Z34_07080 [Planctomycetes bacterium RBG_16_59_8]
MFREFEDLDLYKQIEALADKIWMSVHEWADNFARETVGEQLTLSIDGVASSLVEGDGRQQIKEKLLFTYARGFLKRSRYWVRRAIARELMDSATGADVLKDLESIHKQLNTLITNKRKMVEGGPVPGSFSGTEH